MNHKIFLPMGEKPPYKFGRGRDASGNQASIVTSFPPESQVLQELLALQPAILRSTARQFIVVIFYGTVPTSSSATDAAVGSTLPATALADTGVTNSSTLVASQSQVQTLNHPVPQPPLMEILRLALGCITPSFTMMQPPSTTGFHKTTVVSSMTSSPPTCLFIVIHSTTTTSPTAANTAKITSIPPTMANIITNLTNFPARPVIATSSFNTATVGTASPPVTEATAFISASITAATHLTSPRLFIVAQFTPSNDITTADTDADDAIYAILAAARVSTADDDTLAITIRLLLAIHFITAKDTPTTAAGKLTPADPCFIDTTDPNHDIEAVSTPTMTTYHHVYSIQGTTTIHINTYLLQHFILLLPHAATWAARFSAPSSIYDGALATFVQPRFTRWKYPHHVNPP
jgi:hypothetical protein